MLRHAQGDARAFLASSYSRLFLTLAVKLFDRYLTRATVFMWGGLLSGAMSTLFLAYWFSAKEELQGLKEVYQT